MSTETSTNSSGAAVASASARYEVELIAPETEDAAAVALFRLGVRLCQPGTPVARRVATLANAPRDPRHVPIGELRLGEGVDWNAGKDAYLAGKAGHAFLRQGKLDVADTLEFVEDIDAAHGKISYHGQLILHHNVLDLAHINATGNITIHGSIEAAEVHAGGDLHVHHGICGKERGHCSAVGRVTARFATNARVTSGGDMFFANEVVNSHLSCGGTLKAKNGTILSGHAVAVGGIQCHTAGSEVGVKTILEAGLSPECYAAIQHTLTHAEQSRIKAQEIKSAVEPLLARAKSLTAAQKEKATELLYAANEAESRANEALAALAKFKTSLQTCMDHRIVVSGLLHPGVIIRYPVAEALVTEPLRGVIEIALCTKGSESHIVAIDRCRNTSRPLQSLPGADGRAEMAHKIMNGPG